MGISLVIGIVAKNAKFVGQEIDFVAVLRMDPKVATIGKVGIRLHDEVISLS